jgi:hypothetical protein
LGSLHYRIKRRIDILSTMALCIFIFIVGGEDINEIRIDVVVVFVRIHLKRGNEWRPLIGQNFGCSRINIGV